MVEIVLITLLQIRHVQQIMSISKTIENELEIPSLMVFQFKSMNRSHNNKIRNKYVVNQSRFSS